MYNSSSPQGTYPIYFNGAPTAANYAITTVNGVLTISPAGTARIVGTATDHGPGYVDVSFANTGSGIAPGVQINSVTVKALTGNGTVSYGGADHTSLGSLAPGEAQTVRFFVTINGSVLRYSIAEVGSYTDSSTKTFSTSQTVLNP